jgi:hypothetical protein
MCGKATGGVGQGDGNSLIRLEHEKGLVSVTMLADTDDGC